MEPTTEIHKLTAALASIADDIHPSTDRVWTLPLALKLIDCPMSLNTRYESVWLPRRDNFEKSHPDVRSATDLHKLISRCGSYDFLRAELKINGPMKAQRLAEVVAKFTVICGFGTVDEQTAKAEVWAREAQVTGYKEFGVRNFGIAGWQYLRMLFGANTTKPDVWILRFVTDVVGRKVSQLEAVLLMEEAAARLGVCLRDADTTIWDKYARFEMPKFLPGPSCNPDHGTPN